MTGTWAYGPRKHRKGILIGAVIGLLTAASIAVAVWLIQSDVRGYTKAAVLAPVTYTEVTAAELSGDLAPGGTADLHLRLNNPNDVDLFVRSVDWNAVSPRVLVDGSGTCPAMDVIGLNPVSGASLGPVPANGAADIVVPDAVTMTEDASTACQG